MTEKDIANQAKRTLKDSLRTNIKSQFTQRTGATFENTDVTSRFLKGNLTRITVKAPKHLFIQNYGFEGVKSNGVHMRLKATKTVENAIDSTDVINYLADNLAIIRADDVIVKMR